MYVELGVSALIHWLDFLNRGYPVMTAVIDPFKASGSALLPFLVSRFQAFQ